MMSVANLHYKTRRGGNVMYVINSEAQLKELLLKLWKRRVDAVVYAHGNNQEPVGGVWKNNTRWAWWYDSGIFK